MRLIDTDSLKEYILRSLPNWSETREIVLDCIANSPTIEERKKGEWLRYGEDGNPNSVDTTIWQCDQCLETYYGRTTRIPNYCPSCGAKMEATDAPV